MKMSELISVIVPVYNVEDYLRQCLDSIINQTYSNLEIILVDDGSKDNSGKICDEYARFDSRIIVIHKENCGLVMARRTGLEVATADYVGFVDSDDWIDEKMYEYLYKTMKDTKADVVTTGRYVESTVSKKMPDTIIPGTYHPMEDAYFCSNMIMGPNKVLWGITPNFWNKLFRKSSISFWQERVNTEITYGEDDACVYPCMLYSNVVTVTSKCFYHYRLRDTSMSNSGDDLYMEKVNKLFVALKKPFEKHPFSDLLLQELSLYMVEFIVRGINKLWGLHPKIRIPRIGINLENIFDGAPILLYGAGVMGRDFYRELCDLGLKETVIWVDQNYIELQNKGYNVKNIDEINTVDIEKAIITIQDEKVAESVKHYLRDEKGISEGKIYWCRVRGIMEVMEGSKGI